MTALLIRDVPDALVRRIDEAADAAGQSRQAFLLAHLVARFGEPQPVAGWIRADRQGELLASEGAECAECGQPLDWPFFGVLADGSIHGPVCEGCAAA